MLRDALKGDDPQIIAIAAILAQVDPDIVLLAGVDHDLENLTALALRDAFSDQGADYPHFYAPPTNRGRATGLDVDGDGRVGEPEDNHGYGAFSGQSGLLLLSRHPIDVTKARLWTDVLWSDLPGTTLPDRDGAPFPSQAVHDALRLSTTAHVAVPIIVNGTALTVMAYYATPPVFDGPEDMNGWRNSAETLFWVDILNGVFGSPPGPPFVLLGAANLDPFDGDGRSEAMVQLLADPRITDPRPDSASAAGSPDPDHVGPPGLDTVEWDGPGRLRVDYVLPSSDLDVVDAGVHWPAADDPDGSSLVEEAGRHRLVWVDIDLP